MRNRSFLNLGHICVMFFWFLFFRHKVRIMIYYENLGMVDLIAFQKAKKISRKEADKLLNNQNGNK